MPELRYGISEIFDSVQGEGLYAGTPMTFVRFAGCSVGKPLSQKEKADNFLPVYTEQCASWDGRKFYCDTDFRVMERLTVEEIANHLPKNVKRVCFTGGEPLIHDLDLLAIELLSRGVKLHVETSGTVPVVGWMNRGDTWLTMSPKVNADPKILACANEIKLLVDEGFSLQKADEMLAGIKTEPLIWVQPINGTFQINRENIDRCLKVLAERPQWRLSIQLHKYLNVR